MSEETKNGISRRQFIKGTSIVAGGAAVSSAFFLSAFGKEVEVTKTVTVTQPGSNITQTVTRYTCPVCSQEYASLEELKAHFDAEHTDNPVSDTMPVTLNINGVKYELNIEPKSTLAEVLREKLGMTGTKIACNQGACGACTVLLDGKPVLSCMTLAIECEGHDISTIEGLLKPDGSLDPLQKSFADNFGLACGFCTPGMIMAAKALLDNNANPSKEDVNKALSGNICRCTGYTRIVESVMAAANK